MADDKGGIGSGMKSYFVWFRLLRKRTLKKPVFLLFLLFLPVMSFLIDRLGQGESSGMTIGFVFEASEQKDAQQDRAASVKMQQEFLSILREQEGILRFLPYEDAEGMRRDIVTGELDCGVFLREDLWDGLRTGAWQNTVTIYVTSSSGMTEIVKEKVASILFTLYSKKNYMDYIAKSEVFAAAADAQSDTQSYTQSYADIEEIAAFAETACEMHLSDGSTFAFQYQGSQYPENDGERSGEIPAGKNDGGTADEESDSEISDRKPGSVSGAASPFRLRGVLAICIFLSGLSGLLTDWKDREEKRFVRLVPPVLTTAVNVWIPTVYTSAATLVSLLLTGQTRFLDTKALSGVATVLTGIGKEMGALIFYQFLIVLYCSIIRIALRKQEAIAAAIPLLTLAGIICCPVWIRLAVYLPFFRVLEKLFPMTYYLLL